MMRLIFRRNSGMKPHKDDSSGGLPSKLVKRLTRQKDLKEVVIEKRKSNNLLDFGHMRAIQTQISGESM